MFILWSLPSLPLYHCVCSSSLSLTSPINLFLNHYSSPCSLLLPLHLNPFYHHHFLRHVFLCLLLIFVNLLCLQPYFHFSAFPLTIPLVHFLLSHSSLYDVIHSFLLFIVISSCNVLLISTSSSSSSLFALLSIFRGATILSLSSSSSSHPFVMDSYVSFYNITVRHAFIHFLFAIFVWRTFIVLL